MSRYVGLDVHKQFIEVCILDAAGGVAWRGRTGCLRDELEGFARTKLRKTDRVALEATTNTWSVVAILEPHVARVVVSNPLKTKAIAEAKVKTDKVDALVLAQLLRCDYLPAVLVIQHLGKLGPDAAGAIPTLTKLKLHNNLAVREAATNALEAINKK